MAGFDHTENAVNRILREQTRRMAEMLDGSAFRKSAERSEKSHAQRPFERQAGGHNFTKETDNPFVRQRPAVHLPNAPQYLGFPLGAIDYVRFAMFRLDGADALRAGCTLVEQRQQTRVDGVDLVAHFCQLAGQRLIRLHSSPIPE